MAEPRDVETPPADRQRALQRGAALLARHAENQPAGEDQLRFTLACRLRDLGLGQDDASALLHHWNSELARYPREAWDIDKAVTNAWEYARDEGGNDPVPPPAAEAFASLLQPKPPEIPPATAQEAATRLARAAGLPLQFLDLEEAENAPPVGWLVSGMIPAEGLTAIYGPPKRGKTFGALDLALAMATGKPWLGCIPLDRHGPVVYLALEGRTALLERTRAWQRHYGAVPPGRFTLASGFFQGGDETVVATLAEAVEGLPERPAALFVDTAARASVGLDENSAKDMGLLTANLEALGQRLGCPVVFIHHSSKGEVATLRGSGALLAAVEAAIEADMNKGVLTLEVKELRRGEPGRQAVAHAVQVEGTEQVVWVARPEIAADPIPPEVSAAMRERVLTGRVRKAIIHAVTSGVEGEAGYLSHAAFMARVCAAVADIRPADVKVRVTRLLDNPGPLRDAVVAEGGRFVLRPRDERDALIEELKVED